MKLSAFNVFNKTVRKPMPNGGFAYTLVRKEPHEITDEDRAFAKQQAHDHIWWCFLVGVPPAEIAERMECEKEKVDSAIERIITGRFDPTPAGTILEGKLWIPRQLKILARLREEKCAPVRAAVLLSRTLASVKAKASTL